MSYVLPASVFKPYLMVDKDFGGAVNAAPDVAASPIGTAATTAVQAAFNAAAAQKGGTIVFPNGYTKINGNLAIDGAGKAGKVKMIGQGNSIIQITPGTEVGFRFGNVPQAIIENLTFMGVPDAGLTYDFTIAAILFAAVEQATIRDCQFLGLSVNAPFGDLTNNYAANKYYGIVVATESELLVDRCYFGGNGTNQCPNVGADAWNSLVVRDSQFFDYGYHRNLTVSKTGFTTNTWWIRAVGAPTFGLSARSKHKVLIERTSLDEGCNTGIGIYGGRWADIDNVTANQGVSTPFYIYNVNHLRLRDSFAGNAGLSSTSEVGAYIDSVGLARIDNFTTAGTVVKIQLAGTTAKAIFRNCQLQGNTDYPDGIHNAAGATVVVE